MLNHTANAEATNADATITLNRDTLNKIILKETTLKQAEESGALTRPTDCAVCCRVAACLTRPTKP
ncbi:alkyl sulfatase C-terminal domain-containing protein [Leclercia sp. TB492]|uniref:alkyl sulfatase C-terminal domain-containing protein n=1 Tax=Leclercia sp. TB492 TaxID=3412682 RepID=UPI004047C6EE